MRATYPAGYGRTSWKARNLLAHRVAYGLTKGPIPEGLYILHSCDNPPCCNPNHLNAGTQQNNIDDMMERGRKINSPHPGEENGRAVLSEADVMAIRLMHAAGGISQRELCRKYGVKPSQMSRIIAGTSWAHIP